MNGRCFFILSTFLIILACSTAAEEKTHKLEKRQSGRGVPLSRSRQFPPPEEIEVEPEDVSEDYDAPAPARRFRGRQQPPEETEDADYSDTEAPQITTAAPASRSTTRLSAFNRLANRPRFGGQTTTARATTTPTARSTSAAARSRSRQSSVPAQRIDVASEIVEKAPPARGSSRGSTATRSSSNNDSARKPLLDETSSPATRRIGTGRTRSRSRVRARSSTTTTTTTTTPAPPPSSEEDYYYYYYDEDEEQKKSLATTTSTTTTTTTAKPPSLPRRASLGRRPASARSTSRPKVAKFDPESQFQPPPDAAPATESSDSSPKRFTTRVTVAPEPGAIPPHLRKMYKERTDGRFVDYLRDPNRPRELKGFDLTDYPFYIRVPEDIEFDCNDLKDGYYASVPHHCQLFHYCFAGSRYDFLCANYTLYDQTTFTCRFANNVDCPSSPDFYYRNDDLWKEVTTTAAPEEKRRKPNKALSRDADYEDDEDYEDYDDEDDEEDDRRRRRPNRRRNRSRKNRRKEATSTTATTSTTTTSSPTTAAA